MSSGCPIISNSFVLAKEMLDDETGIILTKGSENELAEKAIYILRNPELKKKMGRNAFQKTRNTTWEKVGQKHASLFYNVLREPVFKKESLDLFTN
jgi:glycosyltransferase involved in cell wall biosynthesis